MSKVEHPDPRRLFSQTYDSGKQADYTGWGADEGFRIFLGQLRLDTILYERVVVVDSDIFDGTFFLDASDRGLLSALPTDRIEIRRRADTLEQSFIQQVQPLGKRTLAGYLFESLPVSAEKATSIKVALGGMDSKAVTQLSDIAGILTRCGLPSEVSERYDRAWHKFLEFAKQTRLRSERWIPNFSLVEQIRAVPFATYHAIGTEDGLRVYDEVLKVSERRNDVLSILNPLASDGLDDFAKDIATLRTWYQFCYKTAQAKQHGCGTKELFTYSGSRSFSADSIDFYSDLDRSDEAKSGWVIPGNFLEQLGSLSVESFEALSQRFAEGVESWREWMQSENPRAARDTLLETMKSLAEEVDRRSEIRPTYPAREAVPLLKRVETGVLTGLAFGATELAKEPKTLMHRRKFFKVAGVTLAGAVVGEFIPDAVDMLNPPIDRSVVIAQSIVRKESERNLQMRVGL